MKTRMTTNRLAFLGLMLLSSFSWVSCSTDHTTQSYDKYYGSGRQARETEAVAADSVAKANVKVEEPVAAVAKAPVSMVPPAEIAKLLENNSCSACHKADERLVGPSFADIAKKNYSANEIVELVHNPKPEHWPDYPPMAPLAHVAKEDIIKIAGWIDTLK